MIEQADHLSIYGWIFLTQGLAAELMVFAIASGLWFVTAEHWLIEVIEFDRLRQLEHAVLQIGPHDARRSFWPQREIESMALFIGPVVEAIHLFIDDIRTLAGGATKQRRLFQQWRLDAPIPIE